tara:strand:+ start:1905 stop:2984 length:1080 start_codon:yes stop_codon:yes gene_type:complete
VNVFSLSLIFVFVTMSYGMLPGFTFLGFLEPVLHSTHPVDAVKSCVQPPAVRGNRVLDDFCFTSDGKGERKSDTKQPSLVMFAQYGVLERSRGCVTCANEENVFRSATMNYSIPHIRFGFGIDLNGVVLSHAVDGVLLKNKERATYLTRLVYDELNMTSVAKMDSAIEAKCKNSREVCSVPFWRSDYYASKIRKAMRAMYLEQAIADFLKNRACALQDAVVVVFSADVLLNKALDSRDILEAYTKRDTVFMTNNNDGPDGYTNGFYVGHAKALSGALSSYSVLEQHAANGLEQNPYETLSKKTCLHFRIRHQTLRGFGHFLKDFVKVRATGKVFGNLLCSAKSLIDLNFCPQLKKASCV